MKNSGSTVALAAVALAIAVGGCDEDAATHPSTPPRVATRTEPDPEPKKLESTPLPSRGNLAAHREPRSGDWFENATEASGVRFAYRNGNEAEFYTLLETVGGGVAVFDYDRDGDMDLFFTGGGRMTGPPVEVHGRRSALFRNEGRWRFTDVTDEAGLSDPTLYTHGCTVGDFDDDGYPDLFVAGYGGCRLYHNLGGGGFEDVTAAAGLECDAWNVTGAWADFDRDGRLDLYVVTYADWTPDHRRFCPNDRQQRDTCAPTSFDGTPDRLWRNRGDGTFEDVSHAAGLSVANRGLGVVATDFNGDGRIDVYVANDVQENQLYLSQSEWPFRSAGVEAGVAFSPAGQRQGSMGVDAGDVDGDGLPDLWYTNFAAEDNTLYHNLGNGSFLDATARARLAGRSRRWVGFGTELADFDGDGRLDLVVANGHVRYGESASPYFQPAQLFRNAGDGRFAEVTDRGGPYFSVRHAGRGLAAGDLDDDGDLDLVMVHQNEPVALLRNRRDPDGWIRLALQGTDANTDPVGAEVAVQYGKRRLVRWIHGGGSYLSYSDPRLLLPTDEPGPVTITVTWPSGTTERFVDPAQERTHSLIEGRGRIVE